MFVKIVENSRISLDKVSDGVIIYLNDLTLLLDDNFETKVLEEILKQDPLISIIAPTSRSFNIIKESIINNDSPCAIIEKLENENIVLYSLFIQTIALYSKKYKLLKQIKSAKTLEISPTKASFLVAVNILRKLGIPSIINNTSISLIEYKSLLEQDRKIIDASSNIRVRYQEQNSPIDIKTLYNISSIIYKKVEEIEKYNLSSLEKIIYVYDLVKTRRYIKEQNSDKLSSRDLDKILLGEAIVCVGYSNLFNAILKSLGINALSLISIEANHQRSMAYIKDDKYNIDGVYTFDPTWDSRREDTNYLKKYNYFGLSLKESNLTSPNKICDIINYNLNTLEEIMSSDDKIEESIIVFQHLKELFQLVEDGSSNFTYLKENIGYLEYSKSDVRKNVESILSKLQNKFNISSLDSITLIEAICIVRRLEYYLGVSKSISLSDIKEGLISRELSREKNKYLLSHKNISEYLFYILSSQDVLDKALDKKLYATSAYKRKIEEIKLLKVLKKIKEKEGGYNDK